jgi:hypothetical protein
VEETYSKAPLRESTQSGLIDGIDQQAAKIRSLQATVDIDTSVGGAKKGHVTDYKEIRGYVLARKPAMLHMIGLLPIVLSDEDCKALARAGHGQVDLREQEVRFAGRQVAFEIDHEIRHRLLGGLDDIALTLQQSDEIADYESNRERNGPVTTAL